MPHSIEIFTGGCSLCKETTEIVSVGKCKDCQMLVHDIRRPFEEVREKMKAYGITSVPTIIIDSKIKVVGTPQFPWYCSDDFYNFLEENYPLTIAIQNP